MKASQVEVGCRGDMFIQIISGLDIAVLDMERAVFPVSVCLIAIEGNEKRSLSLSHTGIGHDLSGMERATGYPCTPEDAIFFLITGNEIHNTAHGIGAVKY